MILSSSPVIRVWCLPTNTGSKLPSRSLGVFPKLLRDVRIIGDYFGFYNKDTKAYSDDIIRTNRPNGTTKELILPPEIIGLLMCYYINGQRVMTSIPW